MLVTVLVALPGALFTFANQRETQIVGAAPSDRVVRLTTASAVFYVATAPLSYLLYVKYVRTRLPGTGPLPWAIWLVPIGLVPVMGNFVLDELSRRVRACRKLAAPDDRGTWYLLNWRMEASTTPILPKLHRVGGPR
jgi:hypothetical protein